ncbi:phage head completion protein [Streptomyces sp. bgisy153]|uniref:phage head completion protein n=1 Tax=Streptomyces sp. bgisy153 TaxID=3413793 RepID=UPI003D745C52
MIGHWLNVELEVWRPESTDDGHGGQTTTLALQPDTVWAKVDQPSATDRLLAAQTSSLHTHDIYLLPDADVRRLDELLDTATGRRWQVRHVVEPSSTRYRKAQAQLIQTEGEPPDG